jgi:hypothetical protein
MGAVIFANEDTWDDLCFLVVCYSFSRKSDAVRR